MRLRAEANAAFAGLETELSKQVELVRKHLPPPEATQPAPLEDEGSFWAGLHGAAAQCAASLAAARSRPLEPQGIAALSAAQDVLAMAWERAERDDAHDLAGPRLPETLIARRAQLALQTHSADRAVQPGGGPLQRGHRAVPGRAAGLAVRLQARARARPARRRRRCRSAGSSGPDAAAATRRAPGGHRRRRCGGCCRRRPRWCRRCAPASPPRRHWTRSKRALRPGRPGAGVPGAALPRARRGLAPAAGAARPAARGRRAAVHGAGPVLARGRGALRGLHAGGPGRGGGQAQRRGARARPASSMPACAASCASATRWSPPPTRDPVARWNHPRWWIERLKQDHPQHWQAILEANNSPGADDLARQCAASRRRRSTWTSLAALRASKHRPSAGTAWCWPARGRCTRCRDSTTGVVSVQDAAAQLAAPLLLQGLAADRRRCAFSTPAPRPGGKTAHLLELADAEVTALDIDPARCERIHETLRAAGPARPACWPPTPREPAAWWDGRPFDAILLDAPCTASGHRAAPPRRALAAPRERHRPAGRGAGRACWRCCGRWSSRAGACSTAPARCFAPKARPRRKRLLHTTKTRVSRPAPGHLMPQTRGKGRWRPGQSGR